LKKVFSTCVAWLPRLMPPERTMDSTIRVAASSAASVRHPASANACSISSLPPAPRSPIRRRKPFRKLSDPAHSRQLSAGIGIECL
jgi:hypothetical protein